MIYIVVKVTKKTVNDYGQIYRFKFISRKINGIYVSDDNNNKGFVCFDDFEFVNGGDKEWVFKQPIQF